MRGTCLGVCLLGACAFTACSDRTATSNETGIACTDKIDNDGDGKTDCDDPDCAAICGRSDAGVDRGRVDWGIGDVYTPDGPCGCNDHLTCTLDSCDGGSCRFTLQPGFCVIDGTCYADKAPDPKGACRRCDAASSTTQWTVTTDGASCDDADPCSKGDVCTAGVCSGTHYSCASDFLDCTTETCDGKGGCTYPVKADWCMIASAKPAAQCFKKGESDPYGYPGSCQACDPTKSQTSWTPFTGGCTISGACIMQGRTDSTGCQVCDPAKNPYGWSPGTSDCKIGGLCYKAGEKDTSGCQLCDPTKSTSAWTPSPYSCQIYGKCYKSGDLDPAGCGICDPAKNTTSWTPAAQVCQIAGKCYPDGAVLPGGCAVCDVKKNPSGWSVVPNTCVVQQPYPPPYQPTVKCYQAGDKDSPGSCIACDPTKSQTSLSPVLSPDCKVGGYCLSAGEKPPSMGGPMPLTCAVCDPIKSKTSLTPLPGTCLVGSYQCYQGGDLDSTGCQLCNPTVSQTTLTPVPGKCSISIYGPGGPTQCFANGATHPTGSCAVCDTSKSATSWTLVSGCLIGTYYKPGGDQCYKAGDPDPAGCGTCDPTKSATSWTPVAGKCVISSGPGGPTSCYSNGTQHPTGSCAVCDTSKSTTTWTVLTGCFINNQCFKAGDLNPYMGPYGCEMCDPSKSQTSWSPATGKCAIPIGGPKPGPVQCYANGAQHPSGSCAICDISKSTIAWTVTSGCLINEKCYIAGATAPNGCGSCDPTKSTGSWTPLAGKCLISGTCYSNGATDPSGCLQCDPSKPSVWTPVAGVASTEYNFDAGLGGVTVTPAVAGVGWQISSKRSVTGASSLYYGDPAKGTYDNGQTNSGTVTLPALALPSGKKAVLSFALYMDTESGTSFDLLTVSAGGATIWSKDAMLAMKSWNEVAVNLSSYAGQTLTLTFTFDTKDGVANTAEGVYLDAIRVLTGCP